MSLVPETVFDTVIDLSDENGQIALIGGLSYHGEYESSVNNDSFMRIGKIIHLDSGALRDLDPATNATMQTGLTFPIFTFSNGVELGVSVWTKYDGWQLVCVSGYLKHNNTYHWPGESYYLRTAGGAELSTQSSYTAINIVKQYGVKLWFNTNYDYGQGQAISGQTPAAFLQLCCVIPWTSTGNPGGYQSWAHINYGELYFSQRKDDPDPSDWVSNPQYLWFGYNDFPAQGVQSVWTCDDLTHFDELLNDLAPLRKSAWTKRKQGDPTQETDPSGPGGGGGNMDPSSDPISFPSLPTGGALASGAIKAFEVTANTLTQIFLKLWNTSVFDISTFQKLVEAPLDSLVQLQCVPINPHNGATQHVMLGNFDTEAVADTIDQEYYTIDCGTLTVEEYWGSALDYSPYTTAQIWVPMVGFRDVDINDIMGKTIHMKYNYSIFDGNLTAQLMCGNAVLYKWPGNVKEVVPVTAKVNDALQRIISGTATIAGASTGAGMAAAAIGAAVNVAMSKTHITRSGEMSGSVGLLDDFMPFLIIHRPIQSLAKTMKDDKGYPSNISAVLSSLTGYTEVEYIHLTGISGATDTELQEIEDLLKRGVIL